MNQLAREAVMRGIEENKALVRRYTTEVFDKGNVAAVDEYLSPDFYNHVTGKTGADDVKQLAGTSARLGGLRTSSTSTVHPWSGIECRADCCLFAA